MSSSGSGLHRAGLSAFRIGALRRAAFGIAAARGRSIALIYHRVTPEGAAPNEVPPNVTVARFREHLEALREIGDIVPLADLLSEPTSRRRVRFAITFDDDDQCHLDHAVPELIACGATATFFLNGRSLHGLGGYWWMSLERLIDDVGAAAARRALGVAADDHRSLAAVCQGTATADRVTEIEPNGSGVMLSREGIRALVDAGMDIGFHTLDHPVLTTLTGAPLDDALLRGRDRLAEVTGTPVDLFAYPHGRTNRHVAERTRAAGYRAAFRTGGRAIAPDTDRFMLGRLGPGTLPVDRLLALIALKLSRSPHPARDG